MAASAGGLAAPAPAEATCAQARVVLWENHGYNGDGLVVCFAFNIPNLANIAHTQPGICEGGVGFDDWDNCVSSVQFFEIDVNTTVCLYNGTNYIGLIWKGINDFDSAQWLLFPNDSASSLRFGC
jgi:hypothetical protein